MESGLNIEIKKHYKNHLSFHYSWLFGDFNEELLKNESFFRTHQLEPQYTKISLDLGAGCGFQTIPLAKSGFRVIAVDFDKYLLNELKSRTNDQPYNIYIIENDILNYSCWSGFNPELIICMGDTLTHFPSMDAVNEFILQVYNEMISNGKFVLSYRDYTRELQGLERFIPVRSEKYRIFNTFLEYHPDTVTVYDILMEWQNNKWEQHISHYDKIKIPTDLLTSLMMSVGFDITHVEEKDGFVYIIGQKI